MTPEPGKTKSRIDADGVKVVAVAGVRRSVWLIALALLLVVAASLLAWKVGLRANAPGDHADPEAAVDSARAPGAGAAEEGALAAPSELAKPRAYTVQRRKPAPTPPPASTEAPPAEPPPLPEIPDGPVGGPLPSGIEAFPPLGTDPPKVGILVPDDFELPEGYVRHYQATDDGELLPPILMFHPDYEFFDDNGDPIELPEDLVVPPELVPPGLEPVPIEVPPPAPDEPESPVP